MLNQLDFEMVLGKVEGSLRLKFLDMFPCTSEEWESALGGLGIFPERSPSEVFRKGFLRAANPMGGYVFNAKSGVRLCPGVLYVPDELVEKILVLGCLP